jgi:hypothetical protein
VALAVFMVRVTAPRLRMAVSAGAFGKDQGRGRCEGELLGLYLLLDRLIHTLLLDGDLPVIQGPHIQAPIVSIE